MNWRFWLGLLALVTTGFSADAADLSRKGLRAADVQSGLQLSCDNGRTYPILAKAISDEGELVTGYLVLAPRKQVYFRLVPMTIGYRYTGQGFWIDGVRNTAEIKGKNDTISCAVEQKI